MTKEKRNFSEEGIELVFNDETFYINCEPENKDGIKIFGITRLCDNCGEPEFMGVIASNHEKNNFYPYVDKERDHVTYITGNEALLVADVIVKFDDYYKKFI